MSILNGLNTPQREAAAAINGPVLILAGAGSGKTRTITYRIAHMVLECGISPYKILAVTFTNKAAKEMKERVERLIGEDGRKATVSTFHSFGIRVLRIYADKIGYDSNFTIFDSDDQKRVIRGILKELVVMDKKLGDSYLASVISKLKENSITHEEYLKENSFQTNAKIIAEVYKRYSIILKTNNGMDFSDILTNTYELLKNPEILERISEKYQYIMVDEYQDTNDIQYKIINTIAKKYGNLCVVGDENQSIYGFRGADISNILNFEKDYSGAKVIKLEENYRSTQSILEAANSVIKNNKTSRDKKLWTKKLEGEKITLQQLRDGRAEAEYVVEKIKELKNQNRPLKDFTVLYRTNAQSRNFEEAFLKHNIKYKVFGGMQFYQRAEIKDLLAYLAFINNPKDSISLTRIINVPKRKIGDKSLEKILDFAKENNITAFEAVGQSQNIAGLGPALKVKLDEFYEDIKELITMVENFEKVSDIFNSLVLRIMYKEYIESNYTQDYESRLENLDELKNSIYEVEKLIETLTLREYLENVSLVSATDSLDPDADFVKVMTIHNSKGLEFPVVFLTGVEDEIFPGKMADFDSNAVEEERRLMYVAITRAETKLFITHADARFLFGDMQYRSKSRFINEIPSEVLEVEKAIKQESSYKRDFSVTNKLDNLNISGAKLDSGKEYLFKAGEKVSHRKFGLGIVRGMDEKKVIVEFVDGKREIASVLAEKFLIKQ
ncbi:MAG: ATP-dependent helicase [Fusobacteriaceae bacterium]